MHEAEKYITPADLREVLSYDPNSGEIRWKRKDGKRLRRVRPGAVAGTLARDGYRIIRVNGRRYPAHRIAWAIYYGEWPSGEIDHKNLVKSDNRIRNLRLATRSGNVANRALLSVSTSGLKGAYRHRDKWVGRIRVNGVLVHLGTFSTPEEAHAAYCAAANENFKEFARTA